MFRKIVSALPYSPALVSQLGFYAKRLKKEEATRRVGLVFTALALVVQSLAVISPPEAANAANASDFVRGGVSSKAHLMSVYDASARGNGDFKDILDYAGITRAELDAAVAKSVNSRDFGTGANAMLSWGRVARFSSSQGEVGHTIPRSTGGTSTVFSRPLWRFDSRTSGSTYTMYVGHSKAMGWFAIMKDCGNLVTQKAPKPVPTGAVVADCSSVRGWAYDARKLSARSHVYLYFGGPPGSGTQVGPIAADDAAPSSPQGNGYGFTYAVPEQYKTKPTSTAVYAVMVPLPGWNSSTVSIGSATIPGNCIPPKPVAACVSVKTLTLERTKRAFRATASTGNGAAIQAYVFTVKDKDGKVVKTETVQSTKTDATSPTFTLSANGTYTVNVTVKTSIGDKTDANCNASFTVAPPDKCPYNPNITKEDKRCKPCPGNPELWVEDDECAAKVVQGKEARNLTQSGVAASSVVAKSSDRIEYTVYMQNIGKLPATAEFTENLSDVLEYAALRSAAGGTMNDETKELSFGRITLAPGEKQTRTITVQLHNQIPATPQGTSEPGSFDCKMSNTFGNNIMINVDCPPVKGVENTVRELPSTGPGENLLFGGIVASTVTYFWARARQLKREVRLVRHDFASGSL